MVAGTTMDTEETTEVATEEVTAEVTVEATEGDMVATMAAAPVVATVVATAAHTESRVITTPTRQAMAATAGTTTEATEVVIKAATDGGSCAKARHFGAPGKKTTSKFILGNSNSLLHFIPPRAGLF